MPYIDQGTREVVDTELQNMGLSFYPDNAGELNFVISTLIANYIREYGMKYDTVNEVVGVLECAKLELYRALIGPYEQTKIAQNGPVYDKIVSDGSY